MKLSAVCLVSLIAVAAVPAQHRRAASCGQDGVAVRLEIAADDADLAFVLVSDKSLVRPIGPHVVLADAWVLLADSDPDEFWTDLVVPADYFGEVHWQPVTYDRDAGLQVRAPRELGFRPRPDLIQLGSRPLPPDDPTLGQTDADAAAGRVEPIAQLEPEEPVEDTRSAVYDGILIKLDESQAGRELRASYTASSDGYDLTVHRVARTDAGVEVYLYRKHPDPRAGEGMLDVVERHFTAARLPDGGAVRVLLTEGIHKQPEGEVAWRRIAEFDE